MSRTPAAPRSGLIAQFIRSEAAGGVALLIATGVALAWANSRWAPAQEALLHLPLGVSWAGRSFTLSLHHWVNDGLMALFFFVVGLEIKRELVIGQLSTVRGALLPVAAAVGGMVVPALLYAALNRGGPGAHGWGIPVATDIAFALGVLALLGPRVPLGLKVFLTALAIADDIGAVLVISVYYTEQVRGDALALAAGLLVLLALVGRLRIRSFGLYAVLVLGVWLATLSSGVHATVAGIVIALMVPVRPRLDPERFLAEVGGAHAALSQGALSRDSALLDAGRIEDLEALHSAASRFRSPAVVLERALHPVTTWFVLPVFALCNAGVRLGDGLGPALGSPVAQGVLVGLVAGKAVGITAAAWLVVRLGVGALPEGVRLPEIVGAGLLGGIGFTMSIFVAGLAFDDGPLVVASKVGILAASSLAGVGGWLVLRSTLSPPRPGEDRSP